jgi:CBS domain-containing protein
VDTSEISYRVADFLKQHAPFQAAEIGDLLTLAGRGRVRFHERNEFILWQGEPHRLQVFVIQQGTVSLWDEVGGQAQLRDIRGAGDLLGIERYSGERSCPYTARSESDVVIYAFPADHFEACVLKHPKALQYVTAEGRATPDYQPGGDRRSLPQTFLHEVVSRRPLADVAARLLATRSDAIAVVDQGGSPLGVVTTASVLAWAARGGGDARTSIAELAIPLLSAPTVAPNVSVGDGVLAMGASQAEAIAVTDDGTPGGRLQAVVTARDVASIFGEQPVDLLSAIRVATSTAELRESNQRARAFALRNLGDAAAVEWLARLLHLVDRAIVTRIVELAAGADGAACWCFAGAAGRAEALPKVAPTLVVLVKHDRAPDARPAYATVLELLAECDYLPPAPTTYDADFHVASVAEWQTRYRRWITDPVRHQMYRARTLFDLRPVVGSPALWTPIESEVRAAVDRDFVRVLANDCLATLPPLTFFKDAVVDREGERTATFYLERDALQPLADVGRVFGVATGECVGRSTIERFAAARARLPEHHAIFREASEAMRVVLQQQARIGISQGTSGSDLPPSLLSGYDRRILKRGFGAIVRLLEFTNDPAWLDRL